MQKSVLINVDIAVFPAGIMQFPFMSLGVPNYITYAMVGAVVGHEVSHAFDDQGNLSPFRLLAPLRMQRGKHI